LLSIYRSLGRIIVVFGYRELNKPLFKKLVRLTPLRMLNSAAYASTIILMGPFT